MSTNTEVQSLVITSLATVCVESALTGIFWVLYVGSTSLLIRRYRAQAVQAAGSSRRSFYRTPMFIASNIIFLTVTAHWSLTVYRLFYAFATFKNGTEPFFVFANVAHPSVIAKTACFLITVLASDAMIVYRLYIIWGYNLWIIIPPCLTWFGMIVCGVGICWRFSIYQIGESAYHGEIGHWITSDCIMTFVTNVYCTCCIAWRIWRRRIRGQSFGGGAGSLMGVMAIVVESAVIHTCWNFFFLLEFQLQSVVQFTAIDVWSPVCGIAFMLINLRVALGWAQKAHSMSRSLSSGPAHRVPPTHSISTSIPLRKHRLSSPGEGVPYPYKEAYVMSPHPYAAQESSPAYPPLTVNITRVVDKVDDKGSNIPEGDSEAYRRG